MSTEEKFIVLQEAVTKACSQKNYFIARDVAASLDFTETEQPRSMTLSLKYEYRGSDGRSIILIFHSYDPSGPFQNLPDMNKFDLKLLGTSSVEREFSCSYED
jgi:hypothetical protein